MSPKAAPISSDGATASTSTTPFPSSTIMIVDDEPTTIEILEVFLRSEGYERFVKTSDSLEAIDLLRRTRPDVLLLDLVMPNVSGMEILTAIRNDDALKQIPVIILTSATDSETKIQALELGATDFLGKPVDPSELALRLRNTLSAKIYQDRLANYDALTGLPNRRLFLNRLERALALASSRSLEFTLLHIDLDRLKQINDTLGYTAGDEILKAVAERLAASVGDIDLSGLGMPDVDAPLSRVSGDEFSLLLPGAGGVEAAALAAQRIMAALDEPISLGDEDLFVSSSIGIARFPSDGQDVETLLASATVAMSHAKKGSRVKFYDPSLNSLSAERLSLENQLRRALDRKELLLHYQPKTEIATGRIIGCVALMRWNHPELGLLAPSRFIPIAEEAGFISELDSWALRTGCQQNQAWQAAGIDPISIAINVSPKEFLNPLFGASIRAGLEESGMDPRHLILDLTESTIMDNPAESAAMFEVIKQMGACVAIDDFGTGYSSLSSLKRFPIDELKIDRSFVHQVHDGEDDAAIVNAIILMGHSLGMKVVAEGVETAEELAFLESHGCDAYQGYLSSRPVPADDFERLLRSGR